MQKIIAYSIYKFLKVQFYPHPIFFGSPQICLHCNCRQMMSSILDRPVIVDVKLSSESRHCLHNRAFSINVVITAIHEVTASSQKMWQQHHSRRGDGIVSSNIATEPRSTRLAWRSWGEENAVASLELPSRQLGSTTPKMMGVAVAPSWKINQGLIQRHVFQGLI